jgi:hypothetical protein
MLDADGVFVVDGLTVESNDIERASRRRHRSAAARHTAERLAIQPRRRQARGRRADRLGMVGGVTNGPVFA